MKDLMLENIKELFKKVECENEIQLYKFGIQNKSPFEWITYLTEEVGELAQAITDHYYYRVESPSNIADEAIQVSTLALKIAEMILYGGDIHD